MESGRALVACTHKVDDSECTQVALLWWDTPMRAPPTPTCSPRMFRGPSCASAGQAPVECTTRLVNVACSGNGLPPLA